jgi:hypothetical protein
MATHNRQRLLNKCNSKEDFQQIQLISTVNRYHPLTNLQYDLGSADVATIEQAITTSHVAANEDPVKESSIQLIETIMKVSSKRL